MAEETQVADLAAGLKKRKRGQKKGKKFIKRMEELPGRGKKVKINKKMQKLFRKRAMEYNSDADAEEDNSREMGRENKLKFGRKEESDGASSEDEDKEVVDSSGEEGEGSDEEDGEVHPGITKFVEGCKAFKAAFQKIMKGHIDDDSLGPILSAHKKLVATKLAEEETEKKVKGEAKKEKHLIAEKRHAKPANFLDSQEKFLISVATKGVVKLFNAINKAQNAAKQADPSTAKNEKALRKRRNQVFFSELNKSSSQSAEGSVKAFSSNSRADNEQPSWAPLRDSYILMSSKLKDWDNMAETSVDHGVDRMLGDSSDEDDED